LEGELPREVEAVDVPPIRKRLREIERVLEQLVERNNEREIGLTGFAPLSYRRRSSSYFYKN